LTKYPATLSGGMQQRVALARVLMEDKPIVLMDEPFSALDTVTRYQLQTLFAQYLTKRTVLLVTHDPLEALRLGHQLVILQDRPSTLKSLDLALSEPPPRSLDNLALLQRHSELLTYLGEG